MSEGQETVIVKHNDQEALEMEHIMFELKDAEKRAEAVMNHIDNLLEKLK